MGHSYVVFGAGRQGTAALFDLVAYCDSDRVLAVEPDPDAAAAARNRLAPLLRDRTHRIAFASSVSAAQLAEHDVALSCAPFRVNPDLTSLALRAGIAFCDLGGNPQTVARQQKLSSEAGATTPVVPDCGVSPGLSNILAVHLAKEHGADRIHVRCGGLPSTATGTDNPLKYKLLFDPNGLISEYSGRVPVIRKRKLEFIEALSCVEPFDGGRYECSPTSNNSPHVVEHLRTLGVRDYDYMTIRHPGHWAIVQQWKKDGYLCGDPDADSRLAEQLASDPSLRYDPDSDEDRLILAVHGSYMVECASRRMRRETQLRMEVTADQATRFSAMELTTSWGITIVAHFLAGNPSGPQRPRGFATPEQFVNSAWAINELDRRIAASR